MSFTSSDESEDAESYVLHDAAEAGDIEKLTNALSISAAAASDNDANSDLQINLNLRDHHNCTA
eukprot:CAMPEP_0177595960 /NCGR_PEP_ID=MMETSP0419_2-20121207/10702_1 /TAXON_ID=582737 /ORGANISM="Tetraselmis sp., Strain GSL018" /LENGTH=63 /DNA_ID=CAMNT_0019087589 /DNA_START=76 /DNA_END=264 /DNA_ORIENTATION=-